MAGHLAGRAGHVGHQPGARLFLAHFPQSTSWTCFLYASAVAIYRLINAELSQNLNSRPDSLAWV